MRVKGLMLVLAALTLAGCGAASDLSAPKQHVPQEKASKDFECASGYLVAYDENGNPYCVPDSH